MYPGVPELNAGALEWEFRIQERIYICRYAWSPWTWYTVIIAEGR